MKTATSAAPTTPKNGRVFLVGSGPGDADLLTVKALRLIQNCDVILYDNLVSEDIKAFFPAASRKFFVGKSMSNHSIDQQDLNKLMVTLARKGLSVCRLKGGDPFIFGRGSEEMLTLHKAGIEAEVVPGITAASGCTSYAGIPLTHRKVSQGCTFITAAAATALTVNWAALASTNHTLVFYMGLSQLPLICQQLSQHGLSVDTPAALIENGTQSSQRVLTSTVSELAQQASEHQFVSPTLIVIGEVVNYRQQLQWFEKLANEAVELTPSETHYPTRLSA
ncbi:MAG: uroporphyrin-III C-methyltransferase [Phenylobacterium sp.]|jgi:uroporphyrin-III C-methyltransferase